MHPELSLGKGGGLTHAKLTDSFSSFIIQNFTLLHTFHTHFMHYIKINKPIQGWSIVLASWKDILSDYVANDRTLGNLGDMTVVYNYGFLFTYGIGFGFPLLLGLPDDKKSCGRDDFLNTLAQYDLQGGVAPLLHHYASLANIQSILAEFELVIGTKLSCIDSAENIESQAVINAVTNLIASMAARLGLESQNRRSLDHVERKLNVNEEQASLKTVAEETPPSLLPQPPSLIAEKATQILTSV